MKRISIIVLVCLVSNAVLGQGYFKGFYYGMSKADQKALVDKKIAEGLFEMNMDKRHVIVKGLEFDSSFKRTFNIHVVFKYHRKELNYAQITPWSAGAAWSGGMSRKRATILKREFEDYIESLGYEIDIELENYDQTYYNTYMPVGEIVLDDRGNN
jgi:hypothetical protein